MQKYKEINGNDYVKNSRTTINETMQSIQSMNSGTAFPTNNLFEGMKCYRTDLKKTYTLTDVENNTWVEDAHATLSDEATHAASATKLQTARSLNLGGAVTADAATFDGTADATINVKTLDATKLKGTASVSTTGNAATASKLATPRTLSLTGNASGSASFDGSGNISINTTVSNSVHAEKAKVLDGFKQLDSGNWGLTLGNVISGFQEAGGGSIQWRTNDGRIYQKVDGTYWQREGAYEVIDTSTVNNYAPTKTGSGASGTWPISISGNAAGLSGNLVFPDIGNIGTSNKISWSGSTDGADIYYQTTASDQGNLVLNLRDDNNCYLRIARNGAFKSYFSPSDGNFHGNVNGNADTATNADKLDGYHASDIINRITAANMGGIVAASLTANGYVKFANGLILQWGNASEKRDEDVDNSTTFPIAFPSTCFTVLLTSKRYLTGILLVSQSKTSFTWEAKGGLVSWVAVGN